GEGLGAGGRRVFSHLVTPFTERQVSRPLAVTGTSEVWIKRVARGQRLNPHIRDGQLMSPFWGCTSFQIEVDVSRLNPTGSQDLQQRRPQARSPSDLNNI
ncbi:MAG: hypothetical protein ACE10C_11305, partial [Candidatus Binatia bacterium]